MRLPWTKIDSPPGAGGRIDIPLIGAHVADIRSWKLRRRGEEGEEAGLFDLHAILSWINMPLWEDEEYRKEIVIDFGRIQKRYRLDQQPGYTATVAAHSLRVEGVVPTLLD